MTVVQEMVYAAMKEAVAQGLVPARVDAQTYLKMHDQMARVLAEALRAAPEVEQVLERLKALHVGDSQFEGWYASREQAANPKQLARDAYAAGMEDPLVAEVLAVSKAA